MSQAEKRGSLCVDAVNGPSVFLGSTWVGWVCAPIAAYLAWEVIGYKAAIVSFLVIWLVPPIIAKTEPFLMTALLRNLFFGDFYDAD